MTEPRKAGMIAVLRPQTTQGEPDFAVLLVRRSKTASFMANAYVFPGGRVDAQDHEHDPERPARHAAARELSEEAGLFVADTQQLAFFARWITPSLEPKRFDADCFVVPFSSTEARHGGEVKVDGREVFDPLWLTPREALARYVAGDLNLPPPTVCTLEELEAERQHTLEHMRTPDRGPESGHVAEAKDVADADADRSAQQLVDAMCASFRGRRPFPLLPKLCAETTGNGMSIVMPWDAEFPSLPGEGTPFPTVAENSLEVPTRIARCILYMEQADESYAVRPASSTSIRWHLRRMPTG